MHNVPAKVPKVAGPMVAASIRTIFVPRGKRDLVRAQFDEVVMLTRSHPVVADMLDDAREDLLAFAEFPSAHLQQIWSIKPLKRLNKKIRNTFRYASKKYWDKIAKDLRPIYAAPNEAAGRARFEEFTETCGSKYPAIIQLWESAWAENACVPGLRRRDPLCDLLHG